MFLNTRILELAILRGSQRQVLPTARAGNVFTGVCPSTGGGEGVEYTKGGTPPRSRGHCGSRYASYWNAVLLTADPLLCENGLEINL